MRESSARIVERVVTNQEDEVRQLFRLVAWQWNESRFEPALCQEHPQEIYARERFGIAINFGRVSDRFAMCEENAFDFTQAGDGDSIEHIVTIVEKNFRNAHECGV